MNATATHRSRSSRQNETRCRRLSAHCETGPSTLIVDTSTLDLESRERSPGWGPTSTRRSSGPTRWRWLVRAADLPAHRRAVREGPDQEAPPGPRRPPGARGEEPVAAADPGQGPEEGGDHRRHRHRHPRPARLHRADRVDGPGPDPPPDRRPAAAATPPASSTPRSRAPATSACRRSPPKRSRRCTSRTAAAAPEAWRRCASPTWSTSSSTCSCRRVGGHAFPHLSRSAMVVT